MNEKAADLGMTSTTSFANPNGLDAAGHFSSARDLIKLGRAALEYPESSWVTRIKHDHLRHRPGGDHRVTNHQP